MENEERSGFILWLTGQALLIRILFFSLFIAGVLALIFGITFLLYYFNVNNYPRLEPIALSETVTVGEFLVLPDEDSYPATVATSLNGFLYTGSYVSGAVWEISPDATLREIPQTRAEIGSVISIFNGFDTGLYILDHLDPLVNGGAKIWRSDGNTLQLVYEISATGDLGIQQPNDITQDANGTLYIVDLLGRKILRLQENNLELWWQAPSLDYAPAGLAFDMTNNRILIADTLRPEVYAIPIDAVDTEAERIVIYSSDDKETFLGFNGITVDENGLIFVAALAKNEIWLIDSRTGEAKILAGNYRGSSDIAYDNIGNRLFVSNWDQSWLLPLDYFFIQFTVNPRLPFSIDVVNFAQ